MLACPEAIADVTREAIAQPADQLSPHLRRLATNVVLPFLLVGFRESTHRALHGGYPFSRNQMGETHI